MNESTFKLYSPLTAELLPVDSEFCQEDELVELRGQELSAYAAAISEQIEREGDHLEQYLDSENEPYLADYVKSIQITVEEHGGELCGCATVVVNADLTERGWNDLQEYLSGQYSDGWGEGFEQRDIAVENGCLNVHFWQPERFAFTLEQGVTEPQEALGEANTSQQTQPPQPAKKYEITGIAHPVYPELHRIRALREVSGDVPYGTLGGFVQSEANLSQGQDDAWLYGELYQHNEQGYISQIAYLDADGNPAPTNAGYTILKRTYHRDGTADTDMYFDANGNPKALSKGQYGIKRSGKVNLLLDRNGNVMLCVDNLLNGFPCMVVVFGCVVCLLMIVLPKSLSVVLTIVYVAFILYETLMFRESGDARMNFVLFSYARKFLKEQSVRVGVINNIWLFIPLGTGLYRWFQKKWVLLIPFVMSVAIETTQYITGLGIAEFDDVFGNTMGGWIGVLVAWTWLNRKMSVKNRT